mmetsp:Transcript_58702/g.127468  ORF Transcript_58702/g.127468 Transcript_58702/m.127468 type:complete len:238 (+) Transcript_58702:1614-2327(+)
MSSILRCFLTMASSIISCWVSTSLSSMSMRYFSCSLTLMLSLSMRTLVSSRFKSFSRASLIILSRSASSWPLSRFFWWLSANSTSARYSRLVPWISLCKVSIFISSSWLNSLSLDKFLSRSWMSLRVFCQSSRMERLDVSMRSFSLMASLRIWRALLVSSCCAASCVERMAFSSESFLICSFSESISLSWSIFSFSSLRTSSSALYVVRRLTAISERIWTLYSSTCLSVRLSCSSSS